MKIVINTCYGGFELSHAAVLLYAEKKSITLFVEPDGHGGLTYFNVPAKERAHYSTFHLLPQAERAAMNRKYSEQCLSTGEIPRDDPHLVQVVEYLGKAAWGRFAQLKVVEIPEGVGWGISEYGGNETVEEIHRSWS